jgi:UTP--glucose-1-phosphate uridylyltransferase
MPLTEAQRGLLTTYAFDAKSFEHLREELAAGRFSAVRNQVTDTVSPPHAGDLTPWPGAQSAERAQWEALGRTAIAAGEVAVAILNGGMATRFGGVVKGIVPVDGDATFLALKLKSIARVGRRVPVFLMNSFATQAATLEHLKTLSSPSLPEVHCVCQSISMRLTPKGDLFKDGKDEPSFYAPGHGDLLAALAHSAQYQQFVRQGGKYIAISNVDNLAATLSPLVIGAHISGKKEVTVEVAPRQENDSGGAPVRRLGKLEVLEGFRFPDQFPMHTLPVFNTNSFVFSHTAIKDNYPFTWFRADKKVDGVPVVQFERLVGEVTSYVPSLYLQVPREGPECRFLPVKAPGDLPGILPWVRDQLLPEG